jgi:xylulokinase
MRHLLGIDISTTGTKAVLVNEFGSVSGVGAADYLFETPQPLWSEQDPDLWWVATQMAVRSVLATTGVAGADVIAIGLTGQMHGAVLLDAGDRVLRPAILWNDQRTAAECDLIREVIGRERLISITGNDALTGFTAPKLVWVREHEPELWSRVAHLLLPKDYVRLQLTGERAVDAADGAGTGTAPAAGAGGRWAQRSRYAPSIASGRGIPSSRNGHRIWEPAA